MSHRGFSHIGLSTLDLNKTRDFYERILGFEVVFAETIRIKEGGRLRHIFFDVGRNQLVAFLEPQEVPGVAAKYDTGINRALGVPAAFYHFAFEAGSEAALVAKRHQLLASGVQVSDIIDHGWSKSIYFKDPNGLSLEYCCELRDLTRSDAAMQERLSVSLAALDLDNLSSADISQAD